MKRLVLTKAVLLGCAMALSPWSAMAAEDAVLKELRSLVDAAQYDNAFQLANGKTALLGTAHFDFLYGVAAVNAGHASEGVLALERHLLAVPANDRARLELAKGYFQLGDYYRARQEFEFVQRFSPPKEVRANIQKYLDAMQLRDIGGSHASTQSYAEIGIGFDDNVSMAPKPGSLHSDFTQLLAGTQWVRRVNSELAVFAGGDLDQKGNATAPTWDLMNLNAYTGFTQTKGTALNRLTLSDSYMTMGGEKYRGTLSLTGDGQYGIGNGYMATGTAQYSELRYGGSYTDFDSKMLTLGGGFQKTWQTDWHPTFGVQLSAGHESNLKHFSYLSREIWTARFTATASPSDQLSLTLGVSNQLSTYEGADPFLGLQGLVPPAYRVDGLRTIDVGLNYLVSPTLMLRADSQSTDNSSNDPTKSYSRSLAAVRARFLF